MVYKSEIRDRRLLGNRISLSISLSPSLLWAFSIGGFQYPRNNIGHCLTYMEQSLYRGWRREAVFGFAMSSQSVTGTNERCHLGRSTEEGINIKSRIKIKPWHMELWKDTIVNL